VRPFTVIVNEVNSRGVECARRAEIDELATLEVEVTATDPDSPTTGSASVCSQPGGNDHQHQHQCAVWTPTEAQGPSTNLVRVQVTDDGSPPLSDIRSFTVIVNEINRPRCWPGPDR